MPRPDQDLDTFAEDLRQEVLLRADLDGAQALLSEAFTRLIIETLEEAGELDDALECHHAARGLRVSGYGVEDDGATLNLLSTLHRGEIPPPSVPRSELDAELRRMRNLWERCRSGPYHLDLEPSSNAFDMALHIHQIAPAVRRLRLYVLTDGRANIDQMDPTRDNGLEVLPAVWDIRRLQRHMTSGRQRESIMIDLERDFGGPIPCLVSNAPGEDYGAILAVIPGRTLAEIYDRHGSRLLELNVRSFLQARGKVNRGIRDTLRGQPGRFLAYNNGISATASAVRLVDLPGGGTGLAGISDLQIVNGGQTTASLHRAFLERTDIADVLVQAKLTVVDAERLEQMVPLISRYANTQNRVVEADFSANDPFHVRVEELSRTVWAPAVGGGQKQSRWFYERARGSYADALARERTPARQRAFIEQHPRRQRFDKTELAKYENAWDQLPHLVSRGAQKNFVEFAARLAQRRGAGFEPDATYFHRLVAKAILFRSVDRLVAAQQFGGYKLNIVAYTVALLSRATGQRINLDRIWSAQSLSPELGAAAEEACHLVYPVIARPPGGRNVTEWAKREDCWRAVAALSWHPSDALEQQLVALGHGTATSQPIGLATPTSHERAEIDRCTSLGAHGWFALANWAKQTDNLLGWERGIAFGIGKRLATVGEPTAKQARHGARILDEAMARGFRPTETD